MSEVLFDSLRPEGVSPEEWTAALGKKPSAFKDEGWARITARAFRTAQWVDEVAGILFNANDGSADWEGGRAPYWEEIVAEAKLPLDALRKRTRKIAFREMCHQLASDYRQHAERLRAIFDLEDLGRLIGRLEEQRTAIAADVEAQMARLKGNA